LQKRSFFNLLLLMIFVSICEVISIGAIAPFFVILSSPDRLLQNPILESILSFFGITDSKYLVYYLTILFCFIALFSSMMRFLLFRKSTTLSFITGAELGHKIYSRSLYQPYITHTKRNSSEVISAITVKTTALIYEAIMPILNIISATFILTAIYLTILFSYPLIALCFGIILSTIYISISRLTKIYLHENSKVVSKGQVDIIKALQEGLGGIRDVLIDGTQEVYCKLFEKANYTLQTAQSNIQFIGGVPRFIIEPLSILLISFLALYLSRSEEGMLGAIPVLAILAYSAQRMLPLMQILFGSWATLTGGLAPVSDAIEFLDQTVEESLRVSSVRFHDFKIIELHKCSFRYDSGPYILKNINLKISCGETIGIIGTTGCGKSTLLDILMGLIDPLEGFYLIDGIEVLDNNRRQWQNLIGHVSQNIFISDASLAENIAFGLPLDKINYERVKLAAKRAELSDTIDSLADGYFTKVGERGVRLSGGQRQRIGLARAFYKDVKLLILDEATSALDESTEDLVMKSICGPDSKLTKIIVAHRLRSLKYCDKIIELQEGSVKSISKYEEVFSKSNQANK